MGRRRSVYLTRPGPKPQDGETAPVAPGPRKLSARVISLNAFIRPVLVGTKDCKDERLAQLLSIFQPFDIICLQELFWTTGSRKAQFLDQLATQYGFCYQASSPVPGLPGLFHLPPKIIDGGLVVASKYPITKADYHTYSQQIYRSIDSIVAKGVLYARVSLFADNPQRYAHVFTTHLQANNGLEDVPFDDVRRTQLVEMVDFAKKMTADDKNGVIILCGDFNIDARAGYDDASPSEEYTAAMHILQSLRPDTPLQDLLCNANNGSHPVTTAGGLDGTNQKNERLDYIFLSSVDPSQANLVAEAEAGTVHVNEFRVENAGNGSPYDTLSDHYAVQAEILFSETGN